MKKQMKLYKQIKTISGVFLITILLLGSSCVMKKQSFDNASKIVYRFGDSSVPPKYHRSYSVCLTEQKISVKVDSYGDILADTSYLISESQFKEALKIANECEFSNKKKSEDREGCTGGTTVTLEISQDSKVLINGHNYNCGGQSFGDLNGDTGKLANYLRSLIPDFNKLVE